MTTMDSSLNILIQSSEAYAPFAGVMCTSLFESNKEADHITIYLITADMSEKNRKRFQDLSDQYGRNFKIIETTEIDSLLEKKKVPKHSGSYATYYKIFAPTLITDKIERLIYLDSDMLINGSLLELATFDLSNHALGMCLDTLPKCYKQFINSESSSYYNGGTILFDVQRWVNEGGADRIVEHIAKVWSTYPAADQDMLNIVFSDNIATLPLKFNVCVCETIFKDYKIFIRTSGNSSYYSKQEFDEALNEPVVLHYISFFGMRPWFEDYRLSEEEWPTKELWYKVLKRSPWNDFIPIKKHFRFLHQVQFILYRILPLEVFLYLNRKIICFNMIRQAKKMGLSRK